MLLSARDVPGPNHYALSDASAVLKSDPRAVFGSSKRQPLTYINNYPGPG